MLGRLLIAALIVLFLVGLVSAVWNLCDWPPPRLILKYGFPPTGGPTGRTLTIEGVEFVELKPGYFRMGSHFLCEEGDLLGRFCALLHLPWGRQPKHNSNECPPHWTEASASFFISRTEITRGQFARFDRRRRDGVAGDARPVGSVAFEDARSYCVWMSHRSGFDVQLPTESEWEYACRAGSTSEYCFGDDPSRLCLYGRYWTPEGKRDYRLEHMMTATRRPNEWGLFDMHGNLCEWTADAVVDPRSARSATASGNRAAAVKRQPCPDEYRILRGGAVSGGPEGCRSACRYMQPALLRYAYETYGLRPVVRGRVP